MRIAILALALAAALTQTALAHDAPAPLCCGVKQCPAGSTQVGADQCCTDPQAPATCTQTANLGKSCISDPAMIAGGIPGRQNLSGCAEVPGVACVGGQIGDDSGPVTGCVCVGDACEADFDFPNGKPHCTAIAVDACCDAGACI